MTDRGGEDASLLAPTRWCDAYRWHGDMLADAKRNRCYASAIEAWVRREARKASLNVGDAPPLILEIGCGSGLLSSIAAREVAKYWPAASARPSIYACEVVEELHAVASQTFSLGTTSGAAPVHLLPKMHSTSITELPRRATLVLGELLDSGFLGEGLVSSMTDARDRLTLPDFESIPATGTVVAVPVESLLVHRMGGPRSVNRDGSGTFLRPPEKCARCAGSAAAEGMHVRWEGGARWCNWDDGPGAAADDDGELRPLAPAQQAFDFDFCDPRPRGTSSLTFTAARAGTVHGIAYWWEVNMLKEGAAVHGTRSLVMSTAPGKTAAPDHWRQCVAPLAAPVKVSKGGTFTVEAFHNEDMVWFACGEDASQSADLAPVCDCGVHSSHSRARLAAMNDPARHEAFAEAVASLRGLCDQGARLKSQKGCFKGSSAKGLVVVFGEGPFLPVYLAEEGFHVLVIELDMSGNEGDWIGDMNQQTNAASKSSGALASRGLVQHYLADLGVPSSRVTFASIDMCSSDGLSPEGEDPMVVAVRAAVSDAVGAMRRTDFPEVCVASSEESRQRQDSSGHGFHSWLEHVSESASALGLVGVLAEPWFGMGEDPGAAGGWGWEAVLLLGAALRPFNEACDPPSRTSADEEFEEDEGSNTGDCKRQRVAPAAVANPPVGKLAVCVKPGRAVLCGRFVNCQALWESLKPLGDVEGVDMSAASQLHLFAGDGDRTAVGAGGAGGGLRCQVTGDAASDAVPVCLAQWGGSARPVGPKLDLLALPLGEAWIDEAHCTRLSMESLASRADVAHCGDHAGRAEGAVGAAASAGSSSAVAHVLALWVDYDLDGPVGGGGGGPTAEDDDGPAVRRWLRHGPQCWHGRQGIIALSAPTDLAAVEVELQAAVNPDGSLEIGIKTIQELPSHLL